MKESRPWLLEHLSRVENFVVLLMSSRGQECAFWVLHLEFGLTIYGFLIQKVELWVNKEPLKAAKHILFVEHGK